MPRLCENLAALRGALVCPASGIGLSPLVREAWCVSNKCPYLFTWSGTASQTGSYSVCIFNIRINTMPGLNFMVSRLKIHPATTISFNLFKNKFERDMHTA